jgi:regulator of replication initiation timing
MNDLHADIKDLQENVQVLLKEYADLKTENEHLKQQNVQIEKELAEKENSIEQLQEKFMTNQLAELYDIDDRKILKAKIDVYLKDIEKCLSLLNA